MLSAPLANRVHLSRIARQVRHRSRTKVLGRLARVLGKGGTILLFTGDDAKGKTLSATFLAERLGHPLYRVDLASVMNKYIGETEKNLAQVFDAAQRTNAVLFFDEADALFGKRSEVRDAHDRYANLEVAYLLWRIATHRGLVILASNQRPHLDETLARRIHAVIDFPRKDPF